jgi:formaldehyde-activating enzyme involved in methanogenesis
MNKLMKREERTIFQEIQGTVDEIIAQVKKLIREGNARTLIIKNKDGKTLFQSHLTIGVAGTAFAIAVAPIISAITIFVMFVNDVSVIVERELDPEEDEYEVAADIIEIEDEEEETETKKKKSSGKREDSVNNNDDSEKTVGKE